MSVLILRDAITVVLLALALRRLWRVSSLEQSRFESGRMVFPATKAVRFVMFFAGIVFAALTIASALLARKPGEWWVPCLFLGFLLLVPFGYPPLLTIEVDGVESCTWFSSVKKIRWEEMASLHYNSGNNHFTIRDRQGGKIIHAGFNADPWGFRSEVQKRTRLPLQVSEPGVWKMKKFEIPYEETLYEYREIPAGEDESVSE